MTRRRALLQAAAGAAGLGLAVLAQAQAQAPANVKLIVGFPPGGSGDLFARLFAERLQQELHSPVLVDNRAGAGGLTAVAAFQRAPADGHTLMMHTGSTAISAPISRKVAPYNPVEDFSWIALLSEAPFVLAVHPGVPATPKVAGGPCQGQAGRTVLRPCRPGHHRTPGGRAVQGARRHRGQ